MNWHASGQILFFIFPAFPSVVQADCALTSLKNLKEFSETSCERSENYLRGLPQSQTFHGLMRLSSRGQKVLQGCFLQISSPGLTGHNLKTALLVRVSHYKQTNKQKIQVYWFFELSVNLPTNMPFIVTYHFVSNHIFKNRAFTLSLTIALLLTNQNQVVAIKSW